MQKKNNEVITEIQSLSKLIGECEFELSNNDRVIQQTKNKKLEELISAISGILPFEKIPERIINYNNHSQWRDREIMYFQGSQGGYLKGLPLTSISIKLELSILGGYNENRELYLLKDGSLMVLDQYYSWSNMKDDRNELSRHISQDQDIARFNLEDIEVELVDRLYDKLKQQQARIVYQREVMESK